MQTTPSQRSLVTRHPIALLGSAVLVGTLAWVLVVAMPIRANLSGLLEGPAGRSWTPYTNAVHQALITWPEAALDNAGAKKIATSISRIPGAEARVVSCKHARCVLVFVDGRRPSTRIVDRIRKTVEKQSPGRHARICGALPLLTQIRPRIRQWVNGALLAAAVLLVAFLLTGGGLRGAVVLAVSWAVAAGLVAAAWRLLNGPLDLMAVLPGLALTATVALSTKRLVDAAGWSGLDPAPDAAAMALRRERGPQFLIAGVTALSFLTMGASRFAGLRWPAVWTATAILAAVLTTIFVGTAILAVWPRSFKHHRQASILSRWVGRVQERAANWPRAGLWVGALLVTGLAVIGFRARIAIPLHADTEKSVEPCLFNLDLVIAASGPERSDFIDPALIKGLLRNLQAMPEVEAVFPDAIQMEHIRRTPLLSKWHHPSTEQAAYISVLIRAKDTSQVISKAARIESNTRKWLRDQQGLSARVTGSVAEGARTASALSRSYIVGIIRLLGMVLMLLVALTWDPRLGLTVALPAAVCLVILLAILSLLHQPVTLPILGAMALVAAWAVMDALSSVLEAARSRRAGASLPRHAASSSLRAAFAVSAAILAGAGCCMKAPFAPAAIMAGGGIMLGAVVSAYGVPTLLAFMPGARLQGPLWEPRRPRIRKRRLHLNKKRPGRRRRRRPKS